MRFRSVPPRLAAGAACLLFSAVSFAQVNVTTYHNDNSRSGANTQETTLSPANVNSAQFGKWFSAAVDGQVYAQPLYVSNVSIGGGTHNVVYLATEHDSLYAIDAKTGTVYWQTSLIASGGTTVSAGSNNGSLVNCFLLTPEIGITATPVIDPAAGTLYVVAQSAVHGAQVHMLHAIDIRTGKDKLPAVVIQASAPGTASDGNGTTVSFNPNQHLQRAALLLTNGHVIVSYTSNCDEVPWHGWVMSYNETTLSQEAVFNPSADGYGNAIWMGGGGPAADAGGNLYFPTGNGSWTGTTDFGDSIVKLAPPSGGSFAVADYFTPYNQNQLSEVDNDVGSGGLVLLPPLPSGEQLIAQMGKEGKIYLLNSANLGHSCTLLTPACTAGDSQIVQEIPNASVGVWGTPAYWNGSLYWGPSTDDPIPDYLKAFSFNANGSGLISTTPTSQSAQQFTFSAPIPAISSNGTSAGILWALDNRAYGASCSAGANCQVLYAYDATNLANVFYTSNQAANNRDVPGSANKFQTPTIANGEVFAAGNGVVSAYGLLSGAPAFATTHVNLSAVANVSAYSALGTAPVNNGFDNDGYAYPSSLVPGTLTWNGATFALGGTGPSAASGATVGLPSGSYQTLYLIAAAANGPQTSQTLLVTYTDGTTSSFTQSFSDWNLESFYPNEQVALNAGLRVTPTGVPAAGPWFMFGYSFALNSAKTVKSLTLPNNRNVVVLAASLLPAPATPTPPFSLTPAAASLALAQNLGGQINVGVTPAGGFTGTVSFGVSGLPASASSAFVPASSTTGTSLIVFVPAGVAVGTYPLTITGTSGTATASAAFALSVTPQAAFSLSAAASKVSLTAGQSASDALTMTPVGGFTGTASFSASGLPAGVTAGFAPAASATGTSLTLAASKSAAAGTYPITITGAVAGTGSSNAFTETTSVTLVIAAAASSPGFTLAVSPSQQTVIHGGATGATVAVTLTPTNGFGGAVNYSVSGVPANLSTAFLANGASATFVLYAQAAAVPGTYGLTITGTSGAVTASVPLSVVIK